VNADALLADAGAVNFSDQPEQCQHRLEWSLHGAKYYAHAAGGTYLLTPDRRTGWSVTIHRGSEHLGVGASLSEAQRLAELHFAR
jgi:hypothetical protein